MGDWRRNRSGGYNNYNQNYQSVPTFARSQYRKPPELDYWQTDIPSWQPPIPSWEKSFVINVGRIPWKRFMYCQKGLDLYPDVYQWDDSAGADAFHNAKNHYWAEINGLPFDNSFPDPDMHIDEIDWKTEIDPDLYKDLENVFVAPDEEVKDVQAGFVGNTLYCNDEPIVPSGWGDDDLNLQANSNNVSNKDNPWVSQSGCWDDVPWGLRSLLKPVITFGCGDGEDDSSKVANNTACNPSLQDGDKKTSNNNNPWEKNSGGWEGLPCDPSSQLNNTTDESGNWNCSRNDNNPWEGISGGWNGVPGVPSSQMKTSNNNNPWEGTTGGWEGVPCSQVNNTTNKVENLNYSGNSGSWKSGNDNWRKRESEGQQMSRYKTTRYHGEDNQTNQGWKNNRGRKRVSFAREHAPLEPLARRQWNPIHTCGPNTQHRPGNPENSWGWDKQVSYHIN